MDLDVDPMAFDAVQGGRRDRSKHAITPSVSPGMIPELW
jgi:hypothetical protein